MNKYTVTQSSISNLDISQYIPWLMEREYILLQNLPTQTINGWMQDLMFTKTEGMTEEYRCSLIEILAHHYPDSVTHTILELSSFPFEGMNCDASSSN